MPGAHSPIPKILAGTNLKHRGFGGRLPDPHLYPGPTLYLPQNGPVVASAIGLPLLSNTGLPPASAEAHVRVEK